MVFIFLPAGYSLFIILFNRLLKRIGNCIVQLLAGLIKIIPIFIPPNSRNQSMKFSFRYNTRITILLGFIFQLIISYCAKRVYPEPLFSNIETSAESAQLKEFLGSGAEKDLDTRGTSADQIIETARQFMGVPHCMGGFSSRCMDCSGLLVAVFKKNGIIFPHNSEEQARYGKVIAVKDELRKGDLVFFIRSYKTSHFITHSGIYLGNNEFIHTSSTQGVTITSLDDSWWKGKFIFGTRIFN